jgi:RNA polymerase sigma-70 factor, ECF subfamily
MPSVRQKRAAGMNVHRSDSERAASFEQLILQYQPELYQFAYRWLRDPDQARDILQETYLKAWRAWSSVSDNGNLRAWLYRIAANTIKDSFRKQRRRSIYSLQPFESLDTNFIDVQATIELSRLDIREQVEDTLRDLPDHYRVVLLLCGSYSYREIARALHLSISATRMRIFRARQAFQVHYLEQASCSASSGGST